MSDQPVIAQKKSIPLEMEPGTYYWCSCGRSQSQPFCDGSHKGTSFSPVEYTVTEKTRIAWCACKHSQNGFLCDGAHKKL